MKYLVINKIFMFYLWKLEKGMATHSNILVENPHGQRSLVGYSPWGHKESDSTKHLTLSLSELLCISLSLFLSLIKDFLKSLEKYPFGHCLISFWMVTAGSQVHFYTFSLRYVVVLFHLNLLSLSLFSPLM